MKNKENNWLAGNVIIYVFYYISSVLVIPKLFKDFFSANNRFEIKYFLLNFSSIVLKNLRYESKRFSCSQGDRHCIV